MSNLVLALKVGDRVLLNGVLLCIEEGTRTRIALKHRARFVFGRQYMPEAEATTPAKRLYYAVQQAYAGGDALDQRAMIYAVDDFEKKAERRLLDRIDVMQALEELTLSANADDGYQALKMAREIMKIEAGLAHG